MKALRILDASMVVLGSRLLRMGYRRYGYAPVATQFKVNVICNITGGIAGCYLVSRWTLPESLTGALLVIAAANVIWITSSASQYKHFWTRDMYEHFKVLAQDRYRTRMMERLVTLLSFVMCAIWALMAAAAGDVTGVALLTGLACVSLSLASMGYLRAAPPPEPDERHHPSGSGL